MLPKVTLHRTANAFLILIYTAESVMQNFTEQTLFLDVTLSGFNILSTYDTISHSLDTARHMNKYSRYMYTTTSLVAVVERLVCRCREVGLLFLKCLL